MKLSFIRIFCGLLASSILFTSCASIKPPTPVSLVRVQTRSNQIKRDIAIVSKTYGIKNKEVVEVDITKIIKKYAKTKQVDIVEVGNFESETSIRNSLKDYYNILILVVSDIRGKKIITEVKVIDLANGTKLYQKDISGMSDFANIIRYTGLLIDIPWMLISYIPVMILFPEAEYEDISQYIAPVNNIVLNSQVKSKFKEPAYICRHILENKSKDSSHPFPIIELSDKKLYNASDNNKTVHKHYKSLPAEPITKKSNTSFFKNFNGNITFNYDYAEWQPLERQINDRLISYNTEGLNSYRIESILDMNRFELLKFYYVGSFISSNHQKEILESKIDEEFGIEKYTFGISLEPFINYIIPNNRILKTLLSVRFRYRRELYFGTAKTYDELYFVPFNSSYNYQTNSYDKYQHFLADEEISFKTYLNNYSIYINLYGFTIGYYESTWSKPYDLYRKYLDDDIPHIFETRYNVKGVILGVETKGYGGYKGTKMSIEFDFLFPINNASMINTDGDLNYLFDQYDPVYEEINAKFSYSISLYNESLMLNIGGEYNRRRWKSYIDDYADDFYLIDKDTIYRGFVGLGYDF